MKFNRKPAATLSGIAAALIAAVFVLVNGRSGPTTGPGSSGAGAGQKSSTGQSVPRTPNSNQQPAGGVRSQGELAIVEAFESKRSEVPVEVDGTVDKVLPDDADGDRHQRFILRMPGGHTVLVAHNIDIATKVPLRQYDTVRVRGEFEWNDQGGVIHWTHRDNGGRRAGGWIQHQGKEYR